MFNTYGILTMELAPQLACHSVLVGVLSTAMGSIGPSVTCLSFFQTDHSMERKEWTCLQQPDSQSGAALSAALPGWAGGLGWAWPSKAQFPLLPSYLTGISCSMGHARCGRILYLIKHQRTKKVCDHQAQASWGGGWRGPGTPSVAVQLGIFVNRS